MCSLFKAKDMGIDLGTANTLIYVKDTGIILNEPSVIAVENRGGKTLAVGLRAKEMLGKAPQSISVVRPLQDGVISDFDRTADMLKSFLEAALKAKRIRLILATNPLFPAVATESRIRWAGLSPEDFEFYTTYENSRLCKPNPKYYEWLLEKSGLSAEDCLMVGNDVGDDMVAENLGMKVFLLTDCLINKTDRAIDEFPHGGFDELKNYLEELT